MPPQPAPEGFIKLPEIAASPRFKKYTLAQPLPFLDLLGD